MAVLSIEKLNKTFKGGLFEKDRHVLRDVTFSLPEGQTSGFVGSNGAGKTTTIKCLFDFIRPDSGQINFFGAPLTSESKTRIGYLPERPYLYEFLTGMEFLRLHWNLCYGSAMKDFHERAHEALKKVDLFEARDRRLRTYSKGMLQRIGIAQAILTRPEVMLMFPTASRAALAPRRRATSPSRSKSRRGRSAKRISRSAKRFPTTRLSASN